MSDLNFDLVVIGAGPAGYGAALYAGGAGLQVAIIEREDLGGTCLHRGCVPAKALLETAAVYRTVQNAKKFGISASDPKVDLSVAQGRKQSLVDGLAKGVEQLLKKRNVQIFSGTGRVGHGKTVSVEAEDGSIRVLRGNAILLAAGSVPRNIVGFEPDGIRVMTSNEVLDISEVPVDVVVLGGGAIGCEFASMFSDLGAAVTIVEHEGSILPSADIDVSKALLRAFKKKNIKVKTGVRATGHSPRTDTVSGSIVHLDDGSALETELIVVSVGRSPRSDLLGLDGTSVSVDGRGFVQVDALCQTTSEGIYAIGDLIDTPQLAHVGFAEAMMVVTHLLGEVAVPIDYANVPWAIYCHPEVAFAGLTETQAKEQGYQVTVSKHRYNANSRAMILNETEGLVKVVAEKLPGGEAGRILGVHIVGPWATEQIGQGYLAVNWEATVSDVASLVQPHPTLSELFGETVLDLTGRSLHG
ncbi:MAG: dihydrolipoyl dehydrogenase [Actinomycetota bacterium]|jgi:dihydrolipoamide dehydrogenase|nr:dihydrolipoyl dehydrogenase [Acidimicrobiales bacterium]